MNIYQDDTVLFYGDSITFHCRNTIYPGHLGGGYVNMVAARLHFALASPELKIHNLGISGNRVYDLENRLESEVYPIAPTVVSILVGVNDSLASFQKNKPSPLPEFEASYRRVLEKLKANGVREIVLMEPFLLPLNDEMRVWKEDLNRRIEIIRRLVVEFKTDYIPLDGLFAAAVTRAPATYWSGDGVHPFAATGDGLISEAWFQNAKTISAPRPR